MNNVFLVDHPLVQHKISLLRYKDTGVKEFRELVSEIAVFLGYEATKDMPLQAVEIETPICKTKTNVILGKKVGIVPILRAGLGMVDGMLKIIPAAKVGHIGLYRNHDTLEPVEYYCKLPVDAEGRELIILDPMLATGGSACAAIKLLKDKGCKSIKLICLIAAPEGIEKVNKEYPEVKIYCAAIDEKLNSNGYIVPGLGDAGDRMFGTV